MNKKSPYSNAYKIGLSVFIVLVVLISTIVISVIKSCEPKVSRFFNPKTNNSISSNWIVEAISETNLQLNYRCREACAGRYVALK